MNTHHGIRAAVRRWWAHRKLHRGQCRYCSRPLADNATSRYCSDDCDFLDWSANW